jgi:hypothetical protein
MKELKRLLAACRDRDVWIMEVLPRFIIAHCCDNAAHCTNVRQEGQAGTLACRKILADLADLNAMFGAHLTSPRVKMVATGDLLAGVKKATRGQLMDSMYSNWNLDPVHGEKVAYTRIGLSLLDIIRKDPPQGAEGQPLPLEEVTRRQQPTWPLQRGGEGPLRSRKKQLQEGGLLCQQAGSLGLHRLSRRF